MAVSLLLSNCRLFLPIIMAGNVLIQDMFIVYILLFNVFKLHITKYLLCWHGNFQDMSVCLIHNDARGAK